MCMGSPCPDCHCDITDWFSLKSALLIYFSGCRSKSKDLKFQYHNTFKALVIFPREIPNTMATIGLEGTCPHLCIKLFSLFIG